MLESGFTAPPFLRTHRAVSACARELELLADAAVDEVDAWYSAGLIDKPAARRTPGRCVVQVGPVALSITWLRSPSDDLAAGELLVVVWHGVIGPRREYEFERVGSVPPPSAMKEVWERVFHPGVVGADNWRWLEPGQAAVQGSTGRALAATCVAHLRNAYESACRPDAATTPGPEVQ